MGDVDGKALKDAVEFFREFMVKEDHWTAISYYWAVIDPLVDALVKHADAQLQAAKTGAPGS